MSFALLVWSVAACQQTGADPADCPQGGCLCESGAAARPCYLEPELRDGRMLCAEGTQRCEGGAWTACEVERTYEIDAIASLISGPEECNPCNPDCGVAIDRPNDADLTPSNSRQVEYDPATGGLIIAGGTTGGNLTDNDGDGVPDDADECPGPGWRRPCDGDASDDGFYHTLPLGGPTEIDPLQFTTRVTTADVYFLMDTTGSMGQEIANLQAALVSGTFDSSCPEGPGGGIIGAIKCVIPDAWFGVGRFDDYPVCSGGWWGTCYGSGPDVVYQHLVDITSSLGPPVAAVGTLSASGGADGPESNTQALWAIATGGSLGPYLGAQGGCPAGRWGYPCFRPDTIPIVIHFTDAPFHNGPGGANAYDPANFPSGVPKDWAQVISALNSNEVRVITVQSCGGQSWCSDGLPHAQALANATGSTNGSGNPYVFPIPANGTGLDATVVDAVRDLAENTLFDVSARAVDNPATGSIDERGFVRYIRARSFPPGRCAGIAGNTFLQCMPGTPVDFDVGFNNNFVPPISVPQVFEFEIEVLLDGTVQDRVPVRIVVPPLRPMFPPQGSYSRVYDATSFCNIPPDRPDWNEFAWNVVTPSDTSVVFELRTADTLAGLSSARPLRLMVPPDTGPIDVGDALVADGQDNFRPYLSVTAILNASSDRMSSPTLVGFGLAFRCVVFE